MIKTMGLVIFFSCLTPKEFIRSVNASPNASFVLSPTISVLSTLTNRSERKSVNYFRKSVYGPGGLYTVARARDRADFFCISDSVTLKPFTIPVKLAYKA